ncbi:uncharacterized protein LOC132188820 isoform X2 [Corylus avellana]|uniref:uncharacterized protein LOC132188820 isoform X2 n=1 Tax=Corylus avellana TaxID=13451 RepID=UPI00286B368A|nr:uncharacterized protein LOC132188820 isoform X2 [Corylus avellana]
MPKFSINSVLLLRRSYSAAVENARVQPVVTALRKATDQSGSAAVAVASATDRKEIFWMRDPKSGNWIPESHFDEIDVVELREKFLPQKFKQ